MHVLLHKPNICCHLAFDGSSEVAFAGHFSRPNTKECVFVVVLNPEKELVELVRNIGLCIALHWLTSATE